MLTNLDKAGRSLQNKPSATLRLLTDDELMVEIQHGNQRAFIALQERWLNRLTAFIQRYVGQREEAEDIVQETLYRVFLYRDRYKPIASFSTWIHTIALNLIRSRARKTRPIFIELSDEENGFDETTLGMLDLRPLQDALLEEEESTQLLSKALISLSEEYRTAFVLRDFLHFSYEEMAQKLDLPVGTVKSRINRARKMFREFMQRREDQ